MERAKAKGIRFVFYASWSRQGTTNMGLGLGFDNRVGPILSGPLIDHPRSAKSPLGERLGLARPARMWPGPYTGKKIKKYYK